MTVALPGSVVVNVTFEPEAVAVTVLVLVIQIVVDALTLNLVEITDVITVVWYVKVPLIV